MNQSAQSEFPSTSRDNAEGTKSSGQDFGTFGRTPAFSAMAKRAHPSSEAESAATSQKTAEAVIDRIRWDSDLNPAEFTVGYEDRFLGVLEKRFNKIEWDVLAQHRVLYFKYKGVIVWDKRGDKTERVDDVFGTRAADLTCPCGCSLSW